MNEPLATVDQLAAFIGGDVNADSADLYLDIASGMVRDYLNQQITEVLNDVVILDPVNGANVLLPETPVTKILSVEVLTDGTWTLCDPSSYVASLNTGLIVGLSHVDVRWPYTAGSWRVTYSHGFEDVPSTIVGVVLGVAARGYSSPVSVQQERIGNYQVRYAVESGGFSPIEKAALARYVQPRIG